MTEQGYMQVSNAVIDDLMSKVSGNAFKVFMAIYRKTKGYNKSSDTIPMSQLHELTGIKDKHTLIAAIDDLELNGFIKVERKLGRTNLFQITNQCEKSPLVSEVHTSVENSHGVVGKIHTRTSGENPHPSKDNTKNNIQKTSIVAPRTAKQTKPKVKKYDPKMLIDRGCSEQVAKDFCVLREAKKAPVTETVLNLIASQAAKANIEFVRAIEICINRGWQSFNASWKWQDDQPATPSKPVVQQTPRFGSKPKSDFLDVTPPKKTDCWEVAHVRV